ncbi:MAG TPA: carbohydrate ABC transporter permease [Terriglobia bacterium]|nr:carbohydrate ABC transporter permease [Terriglobia bacterium]
MRYFARLFVFVLCVIAIAPLLWHGISSLKPAAEVTRIPVTFLPANPTLSNYSELFGRRAFFSYCLNSAVIASLASIICLACSSLASYRLARVAPRVRSLISSALLVVAFFPPIVFLLPLYEIIRAMRLVNHPWALIIPYAALNLPMATLLLTGYFQQIPEELEEAAAMDGLTPFQTYSRIILPLAIPALVTTGILVFIFSWNEFMFALAFMNLESTKTVTVGIATLSGAFAEQVPWGLLAAGVVASSVPLIVFVLFLQKRIVAGLTAGARN